MNIYFGCATQKLVEYENTYIAIRNRILELGHTLTRDWVPEALEESLNKKETFNRQEIYDDVMNAILESDVAIFEGSVPGMGIGHQITFAIDKSKPTLILTDSRIKKSENLFIAGTKSPYLILKNYKNIDEINKIISDFLINNSPTSKVRFNLVLERNQDNYIEWAAFRYKISKTEVIKSAVNSKINSDEKYEKYIRNKSSI